jgi:hypothetical protein
MDIASTGTPHPSSPPSEGERRYGKANQINEYSFNNVFFYSSNLLDGSR